MKEIKIVDHYWDKQERDTKWIVGFVSISENGEVYSCFKASSGSPAALYPSNKRLHNAKIDFKLQGLAAG